MAVKSRAFYLNGVEMRLSAREPAGCDTPQARHDVRVWLNLVAEGVVSAAPGNWALITEARMSPEEPKLSVQERIRAARAG